MVAQNKKFKTIGIFTSLLNKDTNLVGRQIEEILTKKACHVIFDKSFFLQELKENLKLFQAII